MILLFALLLVPVWCQEDVAPSLFSDTQEELAPCTMKELRKDDCEARTSQLLERIPSACQDIPTCRAEIRRQLKLRLASDGEAFVKAKLAKEKELQGAFLDAKSAQMRPCTKSQDHLSLRLMKCARPILLQLDEIALEVAQVPTSYDVMSSSFNACRAKMRRKAMRALAKRNREQLRSGVHFKLERIGAFDLAPKTLDDAPCMEAMLNLKTRFDPVRTTRVARSVTRNVKYLRRVMAACGEEFTCRTAVKRELRDRELSRFVDFGGLRVSWMNSFNLLRSLHTGARLSQPQSNDPFGWSLMANLHPQLDPREGHGHQRWRRVIHLRTARRGSAKLGTNCTLTDATLPPQKWCFSLLKAEFKKGVAAGRIEEAISTMLNATVFEDKVGERQTIGNITGMANKLLQCSPFDKGCLKSNVGLLDSRREGFVLHTNVSKVLFTMDNLRFEKQYQSCLTRCLVPFHLMKLELNSLETVVLDALTVLFTLRQLCDADKQCTEAVVNQTTFYHLQLDAIARRLADSAGLKLDGIITIMGLASTALVLLTTLALAAMAIFVWKVYFSQLKAVTLVLVSVFVMNVLRLSWWSVLQAMPSIGELDAIVRMGKFLRAPDVTILLLYFLSTLVFLYLWVMAMNEVLFPAFKRPRLVMAIFAVASLAVGGYALAVIISYAAKYARPLVSTYRAEFDPFYLFPRLPIDKTPQVIGVLNVVVGAALVGYCIVGLKVLWKQPDKRSGVTRFLAISACILAAYSMQAAYAFISLFAVWPGSVLFSVNYILAEFIVSASLLVFCFLAFYTQSAAAATAIDKVGDEHSRELLLVQEGAVPSQYDF